MSRASDLERQMLDLINEERMSRSLNPVQLELRLNDSSEDHSQWMLEEDRFSHTGENGSSAGDRMRDADFDFEGSWRWGENIAYQSERGAPGLADDVVDLHNALMNSPGHRANILNPEYEVVGLGIETGDFNGFDVVMVTQNFASTDGELRLDLLAETPNTPSVETPAPDPAPDPEPEPEADIIADGPEDEEEPALEAPEPDAPAPQAPVDEPPQNPIAEAPEPDGEIPAAQPDMPDPEPEAPDVVTEDPIPADEANPFAQLELFLAGFLDRLQDEFAFRLQINTDDKTQTVELDFKDIFDDLFDRPEEQTDKIDGPDTAEPFSDTIENQFLDSWECFA